MKTETKKEIKNKARYLYGLLDISMSDVESMRIDLYEGNLNDLADSLNTIEKSLRKSMSLVREIDYIIKLDKLQGP